MAAKGSRTKVNERVNIRLQYQSVDEHRNFDVMNISGYDLILGTPFLFQHKVTLGFNGAKVVIESSEALPIDGPNFGKLYSAMAESVERDLDKIRSDLMAEAESIGLFTPIERTTLKGD